jgi:hypothetical protein
MTTKPMTVEKLITILGQYEPGSFVKVYNKTYHELVFIEKIVTKADPSNKNPDVIFEVESNS